MSRQPHTLKELQDQIRESVERKHVQETALRTSVQGLAESLRPENILMYLTGKLVGKWFHKNHQEEDKEPDFKESVLGIVQRFASGAFAKGIDLLAKKLFS